MAYEFDRRVPRQALLGIPQRERMQVTSQTTPQSLQDATQSVLSRKPRKDSPQARYERFRAAFGALCEAHGGVYSERDSIGDGAAYLVPTKLGELKTSIHCDGFKNRRSARYIESIYLRFTKYSTGKVYDSLCGFDFNGWSGKWNILLSAGSLEQARGECLLSLKLRLELLKDLTL